MTNQPNSTALLEKSIIRYVRAMDTGNLDEIAAVLQIAETDAALDRIISEINSAYADELGLSPVSAESAQVRSLLQVHFPSAFTETDEVPQLTVSQVTARLVAERLVPPTDQETSQKLLHAHIPLPTWLSLPEIRKLSQQLKVTVSDRFLKVFRDAAIQMSMGRGQAQMAATRRKNTRQPSQPGNHHNEENHDAK